MLMLWIAMWIAGFVIAQWWFGYTNTEKNPNHFSVGDSFIISMLWFVCLPVFAVYLLVSGPYKLGENAGTGV